MKKDKLPKAGKDYTETLNAIVEKIEQAQVKMVMAANMQLLWTYWNIGNELPFRTKTNAWGVKVINSLSKDLRNKFPAIKGFSARNLLYMRQFAEAYPAVYILHLNALWGTGKSKYATAGCAIYRG